MRWATQQVWKDWSHPNYIGVDRDNNQVVTIVIASPHDVNRLQGLLFEEIDGSRIHRVLAELVEYQCKKRFEV